MCRDFPGPAIPSLFVLFPVVITPQYSGHTEQAALVVRGALTSRKVVSTTEIVVKARRERIGVFAQGRDEIL